MAEILIGEDDAHVRKWVGVALETQGHTIRLSADGAGTLEAVRQRRPDLLILDIMMPKMTGLEVCRAVRAFDQGLPIMMLTARNTEADMIEGLGAGADDYVTKPFSLAALNAHVAALLRRAGKDASAAPFRIGQHEVNPMRMEISAPGGSVHPLAAKEKELLCVLNRHRGEVLRRDWLLERVWGFNFCGNTRTLDQHIALIRRKLGEDATLLTTIRNAGYRLDRGTPTTSQDASRA